jgi:hypothetical protein
MNCEVLPSFLSEADALARIIALAYEPGRKLTDPPAEEVVRLLGEALQCAYEAGQNA